MRGYTPMMDSIKEVLAGLALIPLSFGLVAYAANRSKASEELQGAMPALKSAEAQKSNKAVYATGKIKADLLGDLPYLKEGRYLTLERTAEVYSWKATEKEVEKKGKKKKEYDCKLEWTSDPKGDIKGKGCKKKKGYYPLPGGGDKSYKANVSILADNKSYSAKGADPTSGFDSLELKKSDLANSSLVLDDNNVYFSKSCADDAEKGCQRLSYSGSVYSADGDYTVIGTESGGTFGKYKSHLVIGKGDYSATMDQVNADDATLTLILFVLSVVCLGGGLSALVGPLLSLIEYIPFIGGFGANLVRIIFMVFAFVVMGVTYLLIDYWFIVLILFIAITAYFIFKAKGKQKEATADA